MKGFDISRNEKKKKGKKVFRSFVQKSGQLTKNSKECKIRKVNLKKKEELEERENNEAEENMQMII